MVKAIIFDCFGVLTTDLWKEFVAGLSPDERSEAVQLNYAYDSGQISKESFLGAVQALTGHQPAFVEEQLRSEIVKNHNLLRFIGQLKDEYRIGLLSNIATDWITDTFLSRSEQLLFYSMVFSHQVGLVKPDPKIFTLMAERLLVTPQDCIMVDDVVRNCQGAIDVGMQAIVYKDTAQAMTDIQALLSK